MVVVVLCIAVPKHQGLFRSDLVVCAGTKTQEPEWAAEDLRERIDDLECRRIDRHGINDRAVADVPLIDVEEVGQLLVEWAAEAPAVLLQIEGRLFESIGIARVECSTSVNQLTCFAGRSLSWMLCHVSQIGKRTGKTEQAASGQRSRIGIRNSSFEDAQGLSNWHAFTNVSAICFYVRWGVFPLCRMFPTSWRGCFGSGGAFSQQEGLAYADYMENNYGE